MEEGRRLWELREGLKKLEDGGKGEDGSEGGEGRRGNNEVEYM